MEEKFNFYAFKLSALIIFVFIMQILFDNLTDALLLDQNKYLEVWRFITAIFIHGGVGHLLYNLFALLLFGSMLERLIGGKNFLLVFLAAGVFANIISINFYSSSLGASGAIFGVIGALILIRPMLTVFAFGLPMPIFIAGTLWAAGDLIGIFIPDNVGNIAHLSGMLLGLIIGAVLRDWTRKDREKRFEIDEESIRKWEDNYLR